MPKPHEPEVEDVQVRIEVEIPRSQILRLRKRFGPDKALNELVEAAVSDVNAPSQEQVGIDKRTLVTAASLLNVQAINSDADLLAAIKTRFNSNENTAMFDLDPVLANQIHQVAKSNGINFNECVKNQLQYAMGGDWGGQGWHIFSLLFDKSQWARLKAALRPHPLTGETLTRVAEEWAAHRVAIGEAQNAKQLEAGSALAPARDTENIPSF